MRPPSPHRPLRRRIRRPGAPTRIGLLVLAAFLLHPPADLPAQGAERPLYLTGVTIVEGDRDAPLEGATVIVEGRTIRAVETGEVTPPPDAEVIALDGLHLIPGLIDAHAHVSTLEGIQRALESGVTTIRTSGVRSYRDFTIRQMVEDGQLPGPKVLASGLYVQPDLGERVLADPRLAPLHVSGVNTPEEIRALVRINLDYGADWIKTRGSARAGLIEQDPREQIYSEAQLRVVVEEAGRAGVPVQAHAHGDEGIRAAVLAGVRSIEHGTYASDETLQLMVERGTYLVPTLTVMVRMGERPGRTAREMYVRGLHMGPRAVENVARAYAAGVPIVAGADTYYVGDDEVLLAQEVNNLVEAGLSTRDALRSATSLAAEMLGIQDRTGSIREGLAADLVVVERNPLEDPTTLHDPLLVVSNGNLILNRLPFALDDAVGDGSG